MQKTFAIAVREYNAAVKTKAFVISIVLLPVMMFGTLALRHFTEKLSDVRDRHYAIVDRTPASVLYPALDAAVKARNGGADVVDPKSGQQLAAPWFLESVQPSASDPASLDRQRYELSQRVRSGVLAGFVEIGSNVLPTPTTNPTAADESRSILYHSNSATYLDFRQFAVRKINDAIRNHRLEGAGLTPAKIDPLLRPVAAVDAGLAKLDTKSQKIAYDAAQNGFVAIIVPFGLVMLMFLVVIVGAIPMMQGVIEEKQQRIAEVLLASVQPFQLMAGKLLGMAAVSTTLIFIYGIGAAWASSKVPGAAIVTQYLTPSLIGWFLVMQLMAVLMFGSMYIAVGASCTDMKEAQALLLPLNLLIMLPLMLVVDVIQHPDSPLARWASLFPTAAPMLTIARIAVPPGIPLWEKLLPVAIVAGTTVVFVWAAGRIFRVGIMAGKAASFPTLLKWVIRG